jgi:lipopolysaccharide/colanic/teichoic acid biosynthesis glycosyltransferase
MAAAAVLLLLTLPLVVLGAVLVKLTSRGPVLYSQMRVGRGGQPFPIIKLRTMAHNCEASSGAVWATARDPRITPAGRFLRATHIDELPQLWNVLYGQMSLIGPRPERPEFLPVLEQAIAGYRDRLQVRPGLTGLAQVQLPADTDLESVQKKLAYDLYYIHRTSPWLDLCIILATIAKVMRVPFTVTRRLCFLPCCDQVMNFCP